MKTKLVGVLSAIGLLGGVAPSRAQEDPKYVLKHKETKAQTPAEQKCPEPEAKPKEPPGPWVFKFRVGSPFQFNSSKGVVGQRDGSSKSFGVDVHAEANWTGGKHEVRNRADVGAVFIKTPNLSKWVTASNLLELENIYQYRVKPWAGPFTSPFRSSARPGG